MNDLFGVSTQSHNFEARNFGTRLHYATSTGYYDIQSPCCRYLLNEL
jgi:hypothetical protein